MLLYHVVEGEILAADAAGLDSAETLNGASADITSENGSVMVNDATVVTADVQASNGVINAIDTVLPAVVAQERPKEGRPTGRPSFVV